MRSRFPYLGLNRIDIMMGSIIILDRVEIKTNDPDLLMSLESIEFQTHEKYNAYNTREKTKLSFQQATP